MPHLSVHQALYGYRAGHELIASSTKLSRESDWTALVMSDRPGGAARDEAGSYLTGFPLHEDGLYALVKTWHAGESLRPGSVWSHMLLVDFETLGKLPSLTLLNSLFVRPTSADSLSEYSVPIDVEIRQDSGHSQIAAEVLNALLPRLFPNQELDKSPIVLAVNDFAYVENTILGVWSEQWPNLRAHFSFAIGSGVFRRLPNRDSLDVQVVPASRLGMLEATTSDEFNVVKVVDLDADIPAWVQALARDIGSSSQRELKDFLWLYSKDVAATRMSFRVMAEVFTEIKQSRITVNDNLVTLLGAGFSKPTEAITLKLAVLGPPEARDRGGLVDFDEFEILSALLRARDIQGLNPQTTQVNQRVARLASERTSEAVALLRIPFGSVAMFGATVEGIASGLEEEVAVEVVNEHRELAVKFARLRPNLLTNPEFWRLGIEEKQSLIDLVAELDEPRFIRSVVNRYTGDVAAYAHSVIGAPLVNEALQQVTLGLDLGQPWSNFLLSRPVELIDEIMRPNERSSDQIIEFLLSAVSTVSGEYLSGLNLEGWARFWQYQTPRARRQVINVLLDRVPIGDVVVRDRLVLAVAKEIPPGPGDRELASLYATTYLQLEGWDPSIYLQLFATGRQLREALEDLKLRPRGKMLIRKLKRHAKNSPNGWRREVVREI